MTSDLKVEGVGRPVHVLDGHVEGLVGAEAAQPGVLPRVLVVHEDVDGAVEVVLDLYDAAQLDVLAAVVHADLGDDPVAVAHLVAPEGEGEEPLVGLAHRQLELLAGGAPFAVHLRMNYND